MEETQRAKVNVVGTYVLHHDGLDIVEVLLDSRDLVCIRIIRIVLLHKDAHAYFQSAKMQTVTGVGWDHLLLQHARELLVHRIRQGRTPAVAIGRNEAILYVVKECEGDAPAKLLVGHAKKGEAFLDEDVKDVPDATEPG